MLITEKENKLRIDFEKDNSPDIVVWKDIFGSHIKVGDVTFGDFPEVNKVEDYLYEITVDKMDEDYALKTISALPAACSEFRNGNIVGRNYDWLFSNNCEFVVRTLASKERHASIGVAYSSISQEEVTNKQYNEKMKLIPYELNEGINDCGVYCGVNVTPFGDKGITTGTHPGRKDLPNFTIPRFVLDHASSAKEALQLLESRNIYSAVYSGNNIEIHALIADKNDTFIVEFVENKMVAIPYEDKKAIMTNFYLTGWNGEIKTKWLGNTDEEIEVTGLTPNADGLERYAILKDGIDSVTSMEDALDLMKEVRYTKTYDTTTNPFWYSEYVGTLGRTIYSTVDDIEPIVEYAIDTFENRDRDNPITWQTVHTTIVNLDTKEIDVVVQEGNTVHHYEL